jgi:biopolymer transport protein ExbD
MTIASNHTKIAMQKGVYAMKSLIEVCVVGLILICAVGAQEATQPALRKGVSVQMPVADHAVEMRAADAPQSTVVAITADGKVFAGTEPTEPSALSKLSAGTVYVKADSRVPFQTVLTVLDALRGKSVVLLAAPPKNVDRAKMVPPYGMEVTVSR